MTSSADDRSWIALAVDRPVGVLMAAIAVLVFGWVSVQQLPVVLLPDISYPTVTVRAEYEGAAPEDVEGDVVIPIEELVGTAEGVVAIESVARAGGGDVVLRFGWGTDLDTATQRVRERLALVALPDGVPTPRVLRYDPALDPVVRVALAGDLPLAELRRMAEDEVERRLERLDGVAAVRVLGGEEEVIRVLVDPVRLQRAGLGVRELAARLRSENVNVAGGLLGAGDVEYLVRTQNELRTIAELADLPVASADGRTIRLRDVATVERGVRRPTERTTVAGRPAVEIAVFKEADANLVRVAAGVRDALLGDGGENAWASTLPDGVELRVLSDQSVYVERAIAEVWSAALLGGLCAIAVIFVFLRSVYVTLVIGVAIPLSMVATFAAMRIAGLSLNVMSLGGLALGVGMLVDNSIVVIEAITRRRESGLRARDAAVVGTRDVALAVFASTMTTVAVFAPIGFVEGVAGELFGDLAATVVLSLCASLTVSLLFVPMLAAVPSRLQDAAGGAAEAARTRWWLPRSPGMARDDLRALGERVRSPGAARVAWALAAPLLVAWILARTALLLALELVVVTVGGGTVALIGLFLTRIVWPAAREVLRMVGLPLVGFGLLFAATERAYAAGIRALLRVRWLVLPALVLVAALTAQGFDRLGAQLVPELHQGELTAVVRLPVGTALEETAAMVARVEARLATSDAIASTSSFMGRRDDDLDASSQGDHYAEVTVTLVASPDPAETEAQAVDALRDVLAREPGVGWTLTRPTLFAIAAPVRVEVYGHDLDALRATAGAVVDALAPVPGVAEPVSSAAPGYPEVRVELDRERVAFAGLGVRDVAEELRARVLGEDAAGLREPGRTVDIEVRVAEAELDGLDALRAQQVALAPAAAGAGIPSAGAVALDTIAAIRVSAGPSEIRRVDGQRAALVTASSTSIDLGGVLARVTEALRGVDAAHGQRVALGGQAEELESARRSMAMAVALAIFLVYVVMAMSFESFVGPLVVLVAVPLSFAGVVAAQVWTATPVSVVTFIGTIVLVGIVVNNAIVLIEAILQRVRDGAGLDDAVVEACRTRLRPVLITALTTVLGLLPMLLARGEGAEIRRPLALVVAAGLAAGTVLTLGVVPVLWRLTARAVRPS